MKKTILIISCVVGLLSCSKEVVEPSPVIGGWIDDSSQGKSILTFSENNYHIQSYLNSNIESESLGTYVLRKVSSDEYYTDILIVQTKDHNTKETENPFVWVTFKTTISRDSISFEYHGHKKIHSIKTTTYRRLAPK